MTVMLCLVLWGCSTGGLGPTLLDAGFLYCILSASSLDLNSSGPKGPFGLMWLSLPHFVSNWLQLNWHSSAELNCQLLLPTASATAPGTRTQLCYIIIQLPYDRPLDLWNRMFNLHQVEITVMQFTGHSLPVHHSVVAPWDLHLVPYYKP